MKTIDPTEVIPAVTMSDVLNARVNTQNSY